MKAPRFRRLAEGDYETADGRFRLYRLRDVRPPAWNIEELTFDAILDSELGAGYDGLVVDGAATKRDALALFAEWWMTRTD